MNIQNSKVPRSVLMTPLRRCGSHALRLRLNRNPEFYSPYPLHIVDFLPLVSLYGDLSQDNNFFDLVTDVVGLQATNIVKWPNVVFDPITVFKELQGGPRNVHSIVWNLLMHGGTASDAKVVMDKSLDSATSAKELIDLFPDLLFINVIRDPRAQISSMNRAIIYDFDTLLNTERWVTAYRLGAELEDQYPNRVFTVRFEDFINDEEATLRRLCGFLELEFNPSMTDVRSSAEAVSLSARSDLWSSNVSAPIVQNISKYRQQLSNTELATIETLSSDLMNRYGYERESNTNITITDSMRAVAVARSDEGKEAAWHKLKTDNPFDYSLRRFRLDYLTMLKQKLEAKGR